MISSRRSGRCRRVPRLWVGTSPQISGGLTEPQGPGTTVSSKRSGRCGRAGKKRVTTRLTVTESSRGTAAASVRQSTTAEDTNVNPSETLTSSRSRGTAPDSKLVEGRAALSSVHTKRRGHRHRNKWRTNGYATYSTCHCARHKDQRCHCTVLKSGFAVEAHTQVESPMRSSRVKV